MKHPSSIIFTLFLLVTNYAAGQTSDTSKRIIMKPCTLEKRVCILFENDAYIILTSTTTLERLYAQPADSTPWLNDERKLFTACNNNSDTVDFYAFAAQRMLEHLVVIRAADLIDENECVVLNKKTNQTITQLVIKPYSDIGTSGKAYYVNGELLFEKIEIVH